MRLIDADAIEWGEQLVPYGNGKYEYMRIAYMDDIDDLPTVEPERKTGHWLFLDEYDEAVTHTCSECGKRMTTAIGVKASYCWNCGAYMKEGEQHDTD